MLRQNKQYTKRDLVQGSFFYYVNFIFQIMVYRTVEAK